MVELDGALRLSSLVYQSAWLPGQEAVARCRRALAYLPWERLPLHAAPAADCVCGIYGAADLRYARPFLAAPAADGVRYRVLGRVSLWGRVVSAELGWRAEFAYPHSLEVPAGWRYGRSGWRRRRLRAGEVARELEAYGVPVRVASVEARRGGRGSAAA